MTGSAKLRTANGAKTASTERSVARILALWPVLSMGRLIERHQECDTRLETDRKGNVVKITGPALSACPIPEHMKPDMTILWLLIKGADVRLE